MEGPLDKAVVGRICANEGITPTRIDDYDGRSNIESLIPKFCQASLHTKHFVLIDLDNDRCPGGTVNALIGARPNALVLRVAVREIESWIMADRAGFAGFMGVSEDLVPVEPERLIDPKLTVVNLARRSRRRKIKEGLVPDPRALRKTGPGYTMLLSEFVAQDWSINVASASSQSLNRCVRRLVELDAR